MDQNYIVETMDAIRRDAINVAPLSHGQTKAYAILVATSIRHGFEITLADVHDAWAVDRNDDRPDHPDLLPFEELSDGVVAYDVPFRDMLLRVVASLKNV